MKPHGDSSLAFGEMPDGAIVHISEVASGLACGCRCPGCGAPLVARRGERLDHHFGHYGSADGFGCTTGSETALHKFAKECLARRLELVLPGWQEAEGAGGKSYPGGALRIDEAVLEHRLGGIVPDVIARRGGRDLLVEFRVTHPCDAAKIAKLVKLNVAAVEIDLSLAPRDVSRSGLEEAILKEAPRRWLHNPRMLTRAPRPARVDLPRRSAAVNAVSLARTYRAAHAEARTSRSITMAAGRLATDFPQAVGMAVPGIGCFTVSPSDWQAAILERMNDRALLGGRPVITPADALRQLKQRGWLRSRFARLTTADAQALKQLEPSFSPSAEAISAWMRAAAHAGILIPAGGAERWTLWPNVMSMVRDERRNRSAMGT
jgi:hypothetical protein